MSTQRHPIVGRYSLTPAEIARRDYRRSEQRVTWAQDALARAEQRIESLDARLVLNVGDHEAWQSIDGARTDRSRCKSNLALCYRERDRALAQIVKFGGRSDA